MTGRECVIHTAAERVRSARELLGADVRMVCFSGPPSEDLDVIEVEQFHQVHRALKALEDAIRARITVVEDES